jgi:hypothetical protein
MIFTEQSVTLRLQTGIDLSGALSPRIAYEKPGGATGEWVATIDSSDLVYITSNDDLDLKGIWKLQAKATIGGLNRFGKIVMLTVTKNIG